MRFAIVAGNFDAGCNTDCGSPSLPCPAGGEGREGELACMLQWVQSANRTLGAASTHVGRITISYVARASRRGHRLIRAGETAAIVQEQRDRGGIMSEHDEGRRAFIVGAVGAGAVASTALVQTAYAKTQKAKAPTTKSPTAAEAPAADRAVESFDGHGVFFNDDHAATVAAFAERLMPGAPGKPGAHEANVINYIDLALAGAYADQQDLYRRGLAQLDAYCRKSYDQPFVKLTAAQQDEVIGALEQGKASDFEFPTAQAFFNPLP